MKKPNLKLILPLVAVAAAAWIFRGSLRELIRNHATLANNAPTAEAVADMIERAADPHATLLAVWNSGGIVHRELAIAELQKVFSASQTLPADAEAMLLAAALDPDLNVRERAFGILRDRRHPALFALAAEQLRDVDQAVRLLGLEQFRSAPANIGVPLVATLLDDADPEVAGESVKFLENWSGQLFGVKLADTVQVENKETGLQEFPAEGVAKTRTAGQKAKAWWAQHQTEFPPVKLVVPAEAFAAQRPVPAGDFKLRTLDGKSVRLADFRGKVVLINFWTTWCTACVSEMPELIALQRQHEDSLAILGVSLDFVPDEDGDNKPDPKQIPQKIARTVKARGINYPILLDEHNEVGGRFNGGELPTTVIVDAQGNVHRRFVGARSLPVFEAMIAEASQPAKFVKQ